MKGQLHQRDRAGCFQAFLNNNWFGAAVFAGRLLLPVSKDTFLRGARAVPDERTDPPRVIGIDWRTSIASARRPSCGLGKTPNQENREMHLGPQLVIGAVSGSDHVWNLVTASSKRRRSI